MLNLFLINARRRTLRRFICVSMGLLLAALIVYIALLIIIGLHARQLLNHPVAVASDAALILGYRTYLHGAPNPCLAGRVDMGLTLAQQGVVSTLAMSGGRDSEDYRIEAEFMAAYAKEQGYRGALLIESKSASTKENLEFSAPRLKAAGINSVIIISEPYHLWRTKKLVQAGHFGRNFQVTYAGAESQCWSRWRMFSQGALREPLAVIHNYAHGYLHD